MPMIDELFAFVCEESPGEEGLCAFLGPDGWLPAVAADQQRIELLRPYAERIARSGKRIRLVKFSRREVLELVGSSPLPTSSLLGSDEHA